MHRAYSQQLRLPQQAGQHGSAGNGSAGCVGPGAASPPASLAAGGAALRLGLLALSSAAVGRNVALSSTFASSAMLHRAPAARRLLLLAHLALGFIGRETHCINFPPTTLVNL